MLSEILAGSDTGTLFLPRAHRVSGRKRWLGFFSKVSGMLIVDAGAEKVLVSGGKSLLPSGITELTGDFRRGDTVEIRGRSGRAIARGLVNFDAAQLAAVRGKHSGEIAALLGADADPEAVHRDNLVLLEP